MAHPIGLDINFVSLFTGICIGVIGMIVLMPFIFTHWILKFLESASMQKSPSFIKRSVQWAGSFLAH